MLCGLVRGCPPTTTLHKQGSPCPQNPLFLPPVQLSIPQLSSGDGHGAGARLPQPPCSHCQPCSPRYLSWPPVTWMLLNTSILLPENEMLGAGGGWLGTPQ